MRPGRLNTLIELHAPTVTADGQGGFTTSYALDSSVWADVRRTGGSRGTELAQQLSTEPFDIVIRQRTDITTNWLIKLDDKFLIIHSLTIDYRYKEYLELTAYEQQND